MKVLLTKSPVIQDMIHDRVVHGSDGTADIIEDICMMFGFSACLLTIAEFEEINQVLLDIVKEMV